MSWELILFAAGSCAILAGCLVPNAWLPPLPNDKVLHFLAFGSLAMLASRLVSGRAAFQLCLVGLLVASLLIEVLQNLVPGRKFCWRDMAANTAGIATAALLAPLLQSDY